MESGPSVTVEEKISEVEEMSLSQDGAYKESDCAETRNGNAAPDASRPQERKAHHVSSRSTTPGSSHQRSSHSSEKYSQASPTIGSLELQPAAIGRSGSALSGVTVPIRLDALSYLLNNALIGAYRMPPQVPVYSPQYMPSMCQPCPCTQMGVPPYGSCMNHGSVPCSNQPGYLTCANQQGIQTYLPNNTSYMPCMSNAPAGPHKNAFASSSPQSGVVWNSSGMTCAQAGAPNFQPDVSNWPKKSNEGYAKSFNSLESEQSRASPQSSFGRFGDNQKEDSWSGRQQRDFNRPPGRGRGNSSGRPWQNSSRSQDREWKFGDRSRNTDFFPDKRGFRSPERSPARGQYSKRGRWSGGRDQGGDSGDTWKQRNQQDSSSVWSGATSTQTRFQAGSDIKLDNQADGEKNGGDEDWETEYLEDKTANSPAGQHASSSLHASLASDCKMSDVRESTQNPSLCETNDHQKPTLAEVPNEEKEDKEEPGKSQDDAFDKFMQGYVSDLVSGKDQSISSTAEQVDVEISDVTIPLEEKECASSSCVPSAAILPETQPVNPSQPVKSNEDAGERDLYTLVFSVDVEENKAIVLELVDDTSG